MAGNVTISRAETPEDLDAVRALIRTFFAWAMAEVDEHDKSKPGTPAVFAGLDAELAGLPGRFGPPTGCLLLARLDGAPAGCVAFFGQDASTMEVKRMFVRPEARGRGIGEGLVATLLAEAQSVGYSRCVLSTHHKLHAAQALYRRAGFREVACSIVSPSALPDIEICMEMIPFRDSPQESHLA